MLNSPLKPPAAYLDYKEGGTYSILVEHPRGTVLHQGSAGFVPGALRGRKADVVFLSVAAIDRVEPYLHEVVDAVGDRIDVIMDGGIQRGTHVLKALSMGAKAVGIGRFYLYALAAAGEAGVERALGLLQAEVMRAMRLMGCASISELSRENLRFRS